GGALQEPPAVPAGDQSEPVTLEDRAKRRALAWELVAELDPGIAGLARLGEAGLERRLAAELRQIVVRPGDGGDADADRHDPILANVRGPPSGLPVMLLACGPHAPF